MGLGRKKDKGHVDIIGEANVLFEASINMFTEAEKKIDDANLKLDATIEEIDKTIADLQSIRNTALSDKERNDNFISKLKGFTTL
jgi:hypothetical protein